MKTYLKDGKVYIDDDVMNEINELIELGLVNKSTKDGYSMLKYSRTGVIYLFSHDTECFGKEITNRQFELIESLRGVLIKDDTNEVIARGMKKFYNLEEMLEHKDKRVNMFLTDEKFKVTNKFDGSLGLIAKQDGVYKLHTSGTADEDSYVAQVGNSLLKAYEINLEDNKTLLVEIISPYNQIVVKYDFIGLVGLGVVDNLTGEFTRENLHNVFNKKNGETVYAETVLMDMNEIKRHLETTKGIEGVVIEKDGFLVKMKTDEYKELHKYYGVVSMKKVYQFYRNNDFNVEKPTTKLTTTMEVLYNALEKLDNMVNEEVNRYYNIAREFDSIEEVKNSEYNKEPLVYLAIKNNTLGMKSSIVKRLKAEGLFEGLAIEFVLGEKFDKDY